MINILIVMRLDIGIGRLLKLLKITRKGNGLVCVKLDSSYDAPIEAYGIGAKWVYSFNLDDINNALKDLAK